MARPTSLRVPKGDGTSRPEQFNSFDILDDLESLVIIGANGSGKSRFGYAIERANHSEASIQRIAAQRALEVPDSVTPEVVDKAEKVWYYGRTEDALATEHHRENYRWKKKPVTGLLNDYDILMRLVFAKKHERNDVFTRSHLAGDPLDYPPEAPSDKVERVWKSVFPHRTLVFEAGKVMVEAEGNSYNASEMSDGERVALYLMASVFVAPEGSILIIDEPEIHLHRAIRDSLFDTLEAERSDCLFVYLTHDVEFATSRPAARRIWLKEYSGEGWLWESLEEADGIPSALIAELLGSRRPVLFVEGEAGSLDTLIYTAAYPDRYVVSVGSCSRVIQFTKALNGAPQLHHLEARGVIDRDRRTEDEVADLAEVQIYVLPVAEIENVLLTPQVFGAIANALGFDNDKSEEAQNLILGRLTAERENQVVEHTLHRVRRRVLDELYGASHSINELEDAVGRLSEVADSVSIRGQIETIIEEITSEGDFESALRFFNSKTLVQHVSGSVLHLGAVDNENGLSNFVRRHLHSNTESPIIDALRVVLPALDSGNAAVPVSEHTVAEAR